MISMNHNSYLPISLHSDSYFSKKEKLKTKYLYLYINISISGIPKIPDAHRTLQLERHMKSGPL